MEKTDGPQCSPGQSVTVVASFVVTSEQESSARPPGLALNANRTPYKALYLLVPPLVRRTERYSELHRCVMGSKQVNLCNELKSICYMVGIGKKFSKQGQHILNNAFFG